MKNILPFLILSLSLGLASCGSEPAKEEIKTPESKPPNADQSVKKYSVNKEKSVIQWTGTKLGFYEHTGTLNVSQGSIEMKGDKVTGGGIVVDMTSMTTTDENYNEENTSEGLLGHLRSPDFFDVESFKTANLIFSPDGSASMTIKGKTNKINYSDLKIQESNGGKKLTAKAEFNRQDFGVTFKIGEAIANDIVKLNVELLIK